ncbi:hypothetical protein [Streptomyces roseoverticillatus]|uniref:hypothetical protein n=1 Tax=Streptomyces roseoverticillatus TaxID=66429 RepID=UPI0027E4A968|nr:hypothetical protein [Streptomyces roseoverticillatus]
MDATTDRLRARHPGSGKGAEEDGKGAAAQPLTGTARGLVVLPKGPGVLTRHATVRGTAPATGAPVLQEVYVDAKAGYPVLQYSGIKTFRAAGPTSGTYVLRDHSRMHDSSKNVLATWDARGRSVWETSGTWPEGIKEFASPTPAFGKEATDAGAVDAHWAAGKVYD